MGGVNMMMHGAGWMEGGLHASLAKMVLDADLLHMVSSMMDPIVVDEGTLAIDAIEEVGPGGHFFGVGHTQERYRTAFFKPMISDWRNYESWDEAGRPEASEAAAWPRRFLLCNKPEMDLRDRRTEGSRPPCRGRRRRQFWPPSPEHTTAQHEVVVVGAVSSARACSIHLTKAGWTDVVLLERKQLTAGSTWHAAGGMHTLNGDPNVARLQQYTVNLYKEIEAESGQQCSIHLPGGLMLADTPERLDVHRKQLAIAHHPAPSDHHALDAGAVLGEHDLAGEVVERNVVQR
jgi:hypothetical protein